MMNCYQQYGHLLSRFLLDGNPEWLIQAKAIGEQIVSLNLPMSPLLTEHHLLLQNFLAKSNSEQTRQVVDSASRLLHEVIAVLDRSYLDTLSLNKEIAKNNLDMREAQDDARKAYQKMTSLIENLPAGAVYIEDDFVMVNRAVEELTGCDRSELSHLKDWFELIYSKDATVKLQSYVDSKSFGRLAPEVVMFTHKDGSTKHLQYSIYREAHFDIWLLQDVTEKIKADIQLGQSSKMASLGQMAAGLAHEINNPLAIIKGKVQLSKQLISKGGASLPIAQKHLEAAEQTVDRIAKIIRGLRSFSRDSSHDPFAETSVQKVIDETLAFCGTRFTNYGVSLNVEMDKNDVNIECRPVEISQVLLNLLNNAFDAICECDNADKDLAFEKWVKVVVKYEDSGVQFSVADSGAGITPEVKRKLMQPFFTTKEVGKGTGLGLSICRGIVENHGGQFYLDDCSESTRFVVWLPYKQSQLVASKNIFKSAGGF